MKLIRSLALTALFFTSMAAVAITPLSFAGHASPEAACAAWANRPSGNVTARDTGGGHIGCTLKDGDQTFNQESIGTAMCPENSEPVSLRQCKCNEGYAAKGNQCVSGSTAQSESKTQSQAPGSPSPPDKAKDDSKCDLDKLKGSALSSAVVKRMQTLTDEENTALIADPAKAGHAVPSVGKGFFTGDYGLLLENLVAKRLERDTCLKKHVVHLSVAEQSRPGPKGEKGHHPDFKGLGALSSLLMDITTAQEQDRKLSTDGGKSNYKYLTYTRGLCRDPKTQMAVKIPPGADRSKIKGNGDCPSSWK